MEWERHVIQGGLILSELLTGDSFFCLGISKFVSRATHAHPT